jgi:two-component system KDP operon response regulator KdpE
VFKVLIVDDEPSVRRFLRGCLTVAGYQIVEATNGSEALEAVRLEAPSCLVLDLGLPDIDGLEVTRRVRAWTSVPIVIVSLRDSEEEIVDALDAGADDYLVKPFGVKELLARLRAALRRGDSGNAESVFRNSGLVVDLAGREVSMNGSPVSLTPTEWDLIKVFVCNAGRVLTHAQLLEQVWGPAYAGDLQLLRVNVSNLRRKIESEPKRPRQIVTELAVGYRLRIHEAD